MIALEHTFENATIKSLNCRTEKAKKNERVLGYDADISVECPVEALNYLAVSETANYAEAFYMEDGSVKPLYIEKIIFNRIFENHKVCIDLDQAVSDIKNWLIDVKIKKFSAVPVFGKRVILSFQIQCSNLRDDDILFLNHASVKDFVKIIIEKPQGDLFEAESEESETETNES